MAYPNLSTQSAWSVWVDSLPAYIDKGSMHFMQTYQQLPILRRVINGDIEEHVGTIPTWHLIKRRTTRSQLGGPYVPAKFTSEQNARLAQTRWCYVKNTAQVSTQEINALNGDEARLVSLQDQLLGEMNIATAEDVEGYIWAGPTSAADTTALLGIPIAFPAVTTAQAAAIRAGTTDNCSFIGYNPMYYGTTNSIGNWFGIDRTVDTDFASIAGLWSNANGEWLDEDVKNLSVMMHRLNFMSAPNAPESVEKPFDFVLYCGIKPLAAAESKARKNNDTTDPIGGNRYDLARQWGCTVFRGFPLQWTPHLDADTSNPVYPINHNLLKITALKGDKFRTETPPPSSTFPDLIRTISNLTFALEPLDPQKAGGRMSYVA